MTKAPPKTWRTRIAADEAFSRSIIFGLRAREAHLDIASPKARTQLSIDQAGQARRAEPLA